MDFEITQAGIQAAFNAGVAGAKIEVTTFKLGSEAGYTPSNLDTALRGTILHTGVPTGFAVIDADTCEYVLQVNADVGTFPFGEVGLYLSNGELFAIATLPQLQHKIARPGSGWNVINIRARLRLVGISAVITWVVQNLTVGVLQELPSFSLLSRPDVAPSNAYIVHDPDDYGNEPLVTRNGDDTWDISTHGYPVVKTNEYTVQAGGTASQCVLDRPITLESQFPAGRYLIQIKDGPKIGLVRKVTGVIGTVLQWAPAFGSPLDAGTPFEILQSNLSLVETEGNEIAFFHALSVRSVK